MMNTTFYTYGNNVRILRVDPDDFSKSCMIDVCLNDRQVLGLFDAAKQFDADFIRSFLNILRESKAGFQLLSDSSEDHAIRSQAIDIIRNSSPDTFSIPDSFQRLF